ncbi:MAG TPA: DNA mismatch repair protein MutS, partial [Thermoplasmata archaeon]|nr:DNA mismatch repair protein MutS [Thermoplasmata archaeon]
MMEQYFRIKENYRDCILLYRIGDFYEMFGEDAIIGSKVLEITLTSRDKGKKDKVPLAGVPWHALDSYLPKLLSKGYKVAICEQVQDPKYAKGLVDRDVVRIVTPGTVLESTVLDSHTNNYLMAIAQGEKSYGLSFVDISTGEFVLTEVDGEDAEVKVLAEYSQRSPKEVLHPHGFSAKKLSEEFVLSGAALTELDDIAFLKESSESMLKRHFKLQSLEGLGISGKPLAISSAGAVLRYLETTQKRSLDFLSLPRFRSISDKLVLDQTTLRNLEVLKNVRDGMNENTLASVLDRTVTPMGSRMLKKWIIEPLMDVSEIRRRLDAVEELVSMTVTRHELSDALEEVRDLERLMGKVTYGSANARDLLSIRDSLQAVPEAKHALAKSRTSLLVDLSDKLTDLSQVAELIDRAIADDPPLALKEGGLIKEGFDQQLDDLRHASKEGREWIARLEETEKKRTGIKNLKMGYNTVFGYYIEVSKSWAKQVPPDYERKQTLTSGERYVTPELKEKEKAILTAQERSCELEYEAFVRVRDEVGKEADKVRGVAQTVAAIDVLNSFAEAAVANRYSKPEVNDGDTISVKDGRH